MTKPIYLDNSMAARPSQAAVSKMLTYFSQQWGHPSQPHQMGQALYPALKESFKSLYHLLGANEQDQFVFTSSGAEAVNHVIHSTYEHMTLSTGRNHFISSNIDEAPALMAIGRLERHNCVGKLVKAGSLGQITAENIADALTPRTALVSMDWANGLTGVIHPVGEISNLCQERGVPLHLNATHILGKIYFELEDIGASFITFNGDQLHSPKGTGGLWCKQGVKLGSFILGGIEQAGLRGGSYNVPGLVALGHAADELLDSRDLLCMETARLRNKLEEGILAGFPEAVVFFKEAERLPHITAIGFPGIVSESLLYTLNRKSLYGCIGGGCFQQIGLVIAASCGLEALAQTAVSFSLSRETTEEEIDQAIQIVVDSAKKLKKNSLHLFKGEAK